MLCYFFNTVCGTSWTGGRLVYSESMGYQAIVIIFCIQEYSKLHVRICTYNLGYCYICPRSVLYTTSLGYISCIFNATGNMYM